MERETFRQQMVRIAGVYGAKYYTQARLEVLWEMLKRTEDDIFVRAINHLIANFKAPPMNPQFCEAIDAILTEDKQRRLEVESLQDASVTGVLRNAQEKTKADPDFVKGCMKLLSDFQCGRINKKQFEQGCDLLDQTAKQLDPNGGLRQKFFKDKKGYEYVQWYDIEDQRR